MAHEYGYSYEEARPSGSAGGNLEVPWPFTAKVLFEEKMKAKVLSTTTRAARVTCDHRASR